MTEQNNTGSLPCALDAGAEATHQDMRRHLMSTLGADPLRVDEFRCFKALAYTVRDHLVKRWVETQRSYYDHHAKRVYYLSLEFLLGRLMGNCTLNLQIDEGCHEAVRAMGYDLEELEEEEFDAGLGNGGLGRLAACFLDSMATLGIPAYGYGIRYDFGMFQQSIVNGYQIEKPDYWLRYGNAWEINRPEHLYEVNFGGRVSSHVDDDGWLQYQWTDTEKVMAMPCDILIPGYANGNVINLRLWAAKSTQEFNLEYFNLGNYVEAVEAKARTENISKVLYPSEEVREGRELRLKQEYFFVSATFQDILRRFTKKHTDFNLFPERIAIQLNDTHPAIAIPELLRILIDDEHLAWDQAWRICVNTFAYTNHTVMPEALETWPVELIGRILPRHLQIIYEINSRFLAQVAAQFPDDPDRLARVSLIQEGPERRVRMAHLAIVGSHSVNGVAAIHTEILKKQVFKDFHEIFPDRFNNKTNGITPRRWLMQSNGSLSKLITERIGPDWIVDLDRLKELADLASDEDFRNRWYEVKHYNKTRLAEFIKKRTGTAINVDTIFDVQVKRIHEYKRQLLNILQVITLYNRLKNNPSRSFTPKTVIFGGKAAPGYWMAKKIIKLINSVAEVVNQDPIVSDLLQVVFVPNYSVSSAEKIIPAADVSEQISMAGTEASGTGNMKFALNGALTIGTLDGANVEIMEAVGRDNIFIFGMNADEVIEFKRQGYDPWSYYQSDDELKTVLDMIREGAFCPKEPDLFKPIVRSLLEDGDRFLVLAEYRSYLECQELIGREYLNRETWTVKSILNAANMGRFSSDNTIRQYAEDIWNVKPIELSKGI